MKEKNDYQIVSLPRGEANCKLGLCPEEEDAVYVLCSLFNLGDVYCFARQGDPWVEGTGVWKAQYEGIQILVLNQQIPESSLGMQSVLRNWCGVILARKFDDNTVPAWLGRDSAVIHETKNYLIYLCGAQPSQINFFADVFKKCLDLACCNPGFFTTVLKRELTPYEYCCVQEQTNSSLIKQVVCSFLAETKKRKRFLEIGTGFSPMFSAISYAVAKNGGESFAFELFDTKKQKQGPLASYFDQTGVVLPGWTGRLYCVPDYNLVTKIYNSQIVPDLVNISLKLGSFCTKAYLETLLSVMQEGLLILDDVEFTVPDDLEEHIQKYAIPVFDGGSFRIYLRAQKTTENKACAAELKNKLHVLWEYLRCGKHQAMENAYTSEFDPEQAIRAAVGVVVYNHEDFIYNCLDSLYSQKGNFKLDVIICDDGSTDKSQSIIREYIETHSDTERIHWVPVLREKNVGLQNNLRDLMKRLKSGDYDFFSLLDGDDYYCSDKRMELNIENLLKNPQCTVSVHKPIITKVDNQTIEPFPMEFTWEYANIDDIIETNIVGSSCLSLFSGRVLRKFDMSAFDKIHMVSDWFMDIFAATIGDLAALPVGLSCYHRRSDSEWSHLSADKKNIAMKKALNQYNQFFSFWYDKHISRSYSTVERWSPDDVELAIVDDIFPAIESGFRYSEFTGLLGEFGNASIYCTGESYYFLPNAVFSDRLMEYKLRHPELAHKIKAPVEKVYPLKAKLLYCDFASIAHDTVLPLAEYNEIPFVFTLYPGGGLSLNDPQSDERLRSIFASRCFAGVIATQSATRDYLLKKNLCPSDKIHFIYGGMTVPENYNRSLKHKQHWGVNKHTLDICFVAQRYSETGKEKGYDTFVAEAKRLSEKYDYIHFHVVGGWDESVLDVSGIKNLTFHGVFKADDFHAFYDKMDIIISANVPASSGQFDGFPTTCALDAMLHGVAAFVSDPLKMNKGFFEEGKDIVIIDSDVDKTVRVLEEYIASPERLRQLAENAYQRCNILFGYEYQVKEREKIFREIIKNAQCADNLIKEESKAVNPSRRKNKVIAYYLPPFMKKPNLYWLWKLYMNIVPEALKDIYRKLKRKMRISWKPI